MNTLSLSLNNGSLYYDFLILKSKAGIPGLWILERDNLKKDRDKYLSNNSRTLDRVMMSARDLKQFAREIRRVVNLKSELEIKLNLTFFNDCPQIHISVKYSPKRELINNKKKEDIFIFHYNIKSLYAYSSVYECRDSNQYVYFYDYYNLAADAYTEEQLLNFASQLEIAAKKAENLPLPSPEAVEPKVIYPENMLRLLMFDVYHYHFLRLTPIASNFELWELEIGKWYKNQRLNMLSKLTSPILMNKKGLIQFAKEIRRVLRNKPSMTRTAHSHPISLTFLSNKPELTMSLIFRFDGNRQLSKAEKTDREHDTLQLKVSFNKVYAYPERVDGDTAFFDDEPGVLYTYAYFRPDELSIFADQLEAAANAVV